MPGARTRVGAEAPKRIQLTTFTGKDNLAKNKAGQLILGAKRMAELRKAAANRQRRVRRAVKKYYGEFNWENINKYKRAENRVQALELDLSTIKSVKDYKATLEWLNRDKTEAYKEEMTYKRRDWVYAMMEGSYGITVEDFPEFMEAISYMSSDEILQWQTKYARLVKDIFFHYKRHDRAIEGADDNWLDEVQEILDSFEDITGKKFPTARESMQVE